jgi:hypothetical protein
MPSNHDDIADRIEERIRQGCANRDLADGLHAQVDEIHAAIKALKPWQFIRRGRGIRRAQQLLDQGRAIQSETNALIMENFDDLARLRH